MAVKSVKGPSMIETFQEFKETKNIDRTTLVSVLEESFRNVIAKMFGSDENYDVIVNPDKGDFEIHRNRIVVADGEVQDENKEIALSEAQKIEPDYEVGEEVSEEVDFQKFGRRAILNLRQTLASKILELEHDSLYNKYKDKVGQVVSAFLLTTTTRVKPYVLLSRKYRTRITILASSSHAPVPSSWSVCWKPRFLRFRTVLLLSVVLPACQVSVPRWLSRATTTASIQ